MMTPTLSEMKALFDLRGKQKSFPIVRAALTCQRELS